MATARFRIQEHTLSASHIREYPRATADDQEDVLRLAVKQYTPIEYSLRDQHDVTIIGAHANGFPKELYEPLWDDLHDRLKAQNIRIRSIWIADVVNQGHSGVLNEAQLGNDPSWMDHPRDLFLMVNHFRKHMKRPLVGIGHSMGGNHLINLSLMHPRLFTSLILIDPVVQRTAPSPGGGFLPAKASAVRRDRWPNKKAAEAAFKRSKFYQTWDTRVLDKWIEHGLRELPTALYPEVNAASVLPAVTTDISTTSVHPHKYTDREMTLKTTRDQEVLTFLRPNFPTAEYPSPSTAPNPTTHLDVDVNATTIPFYRPEPINTFSRLPHLRPSVFYVFGEKSDLSAPVLIADKLANTGVGVGGSGGAIKGRVAQVTFKGIGHLIPMEVVSQTADACAGWLIPELEGWRAIEQAERKAWAEVPQRLRNQMSPAAKETMLNFRVDTGRASRAPGGSKL